MTTAINACAPLQSECAAIRERLTPRISYLGVLRGEAAVQLLTHQAILASQCAYRSSGPQREAWERIARKLSETLGRTAAGTRFCFALDVREDLRDDWLQVGRFDSANAAYRYCDESAAVPVDQRRVRIATGAES